jgi:hypothetical protein
VSQGQFHQTVEQQNERMFLEEREAKRIERANEILAEMRDEQFREHIEEKFPYLKGWK